jgi:hypothetical protein
MAGMDAGKAAGRLVRRVGTAGRMTWRARFAQSLFVPGPDGRLRLVGSHPLACAVVLPLMALGPLLAVLRGAERLAMTVATRRERTALSRRM